jgi:hypothetical protein
VDSTTQVLTTVIIVLALAITLLATQVARRRREGFPLRPLPAYDVMPQIVGAAIEADRPVMVSFGGSGIGGNNTLLTLASAELFYQVAQRAAIGAASPILAISDPSAIPLGYGTLRRAYATRGRLERFRGSGVRWLPAGPRSLAFASGLTAIMGDDRVAGNVLVGSFGIELALILFASNRRRLASVAASDQLEGQAIAWALSEHPLIGEEMFVAGAYLGDSATQLGSIVALDTLRWVLIVGIIIATALLLQQPVVDAINRFLNSGGG